MLVLAKRVGARWALPIASIAALLIPSVGLAAEVETRGEIGIIGGVAGTGQNLAGTDEDFKPGPVLGLRVGHRLTDAVTWFEDLTWARYRTSLFPGDADLYELRTGLDLMADSGRKWRRFASGAVGFVKGDLERREFDGRDLSFDRLFLSVGFGYRRSFGPNAFRWEIRGERTLGHDGLERDPVTNVHALLGFMWGIGGPPTDSDGDTVPDRRDDCPNTPRGALVDPSGCPIDSDADNVPDGLDTCPNTPRGFTVDINGCPLDADGDGVPDGADGCPSTPRGATVDDKGCPSDGDGDGVFDGLDRCPDTPRGARVDPAGCPLDGDRDGIYDGLDACPDTPAGARVDARGCTIPVEPPKAPPLFEGTKTTLVLDGVHFANDSSVLTPDSVVVLGRVADSLRDHPEVKVEIDGHTDARGTAQHNLILSRQRAESVERELIAKGVDPRRLTTKGFGESRPVAPNESEEGRARNRRVELKKID